MVAIRPWHKFLRAMRDDAGNLLNVETLPMPRELVYDGARLSASDSNFCIGNRAIAMLAFGCPTDPRRRPTPGRCPFRAGVSSEIPRPKWPGARPPSTA